MSLYYWGSLGCGSNIKYCNFERFMEVLLSMWKWTFKVSLCALDGNFTPFFILVVLCTEPAKRANVSFKHLNQVFPFLSHHHISPLRRLVMLYTRRFLRIFVLSISNKNNPNNKSFFLLACRRGTGVVSMMLIVFSYWIQLTTWWWKYICDQGIWIWIR